MLQNSLRRNYIWERVALGATQPRLPDYGRCVEAGVEIKKHAGIY
jgi:hypothetical protein